MLNAVEIYKSLSRPPKEALREIQAGKLKGKTDINPQWRYKAMTETFGLVGCGWKYEIQKLWTEPGAGNEKLAFAQVAVYIKEAESWSEPIVGIGGSKLVQMEKGSAVSNDEGYKMAVTDAFSTALKMIGVAADIYAGLWNGTKYSESVELKGGESTEEEKAELKALLNNTKNGKPIFTKQEALNYSNMRKDKTAAEVIAIVKADLQKKLAPEPVQEVAEAVQGEVQMEIF